MDEETLPTMRFFQDAETFQLLRTQIFPALLAQADTSGKTLRLWSAGCATGEDAYSLAMLLVDLLGEALPSWTIRIFATDLQGSPSEGISPESHHRHLIEDHCARCFEPSKHDSHVDPLLRNLIHFGHHTFLHDPPFPHLDLILCRQLLSTCPSEHQEERLRLLALSLASRKGYLVLGSAETLPLSFAGFQRFTQTAPIYHVAACPSLSTEATTPSTLLLKKLLQNTLPPAPEKAALPPLSLEAVLHRLAPYGIIIIDQSYRILLANRAAHRLCSLPENVHLQDFFHAVPGIPYTLVRAAIATAFFEGNAQTLPEVALSPTEGGNGRILSMDLCLLPTEVATPHHLVIYLSLVTELIVTRHTHRSMLEAFQQLQATSATLTQQHTLLLQAHQRLQETSTLLLSAYEQLQRAYEECLIRNSTLEQEQEELCVELEVAYDEQRLNGGTQA